MRYVPTLFCLSLLAPAASAEEFVLRDTIGCGLFSYERCEVGDTRTAWATDGGPGAFSLTDQSTTWSMPGMTLANPIGRDLIVTRASAVIVVYDNLVQTDDVDLLEQTTLQFHLWSGGIEGEGDSFADNPMGAEVDGHVAIDMLFNTDLFASRLGTTVGNQGFPHATYLMTADMTPYDVVIAADDQPAFAFAKRLTGGPPIDFLTQLSVVDIDDEDAYQTETTPSGQLPGYIMSQLGQPTPNFASSVTAAFVDADYDGNGAAAGADFLLWQRNLGVQGGDPYGPGDGTGEGDVTSADLVVWQAQFGTTLEDLALSTATSRSAPEPGGFLLMLLGALIARAVIG